MSRFVGSVLCSVLSKPILFLVCKVHPVQNSGSHPQCIFYHFTIVYAPNSSLSLILSANVTDFDFTTREGELSTPAISYFELCNFCSSTANAFLSHPVRSC